MVMGRARPFMYAEDEATLLFNDGKPHFLGQAFQDLQRNSNGLAIIGDKRNDENSIICQIHLAFIKYHNAVVERLKKQDKRDRNRPLISSYQHAMRFAGPIKK